MQPIRNIIFDLGGVFIDIDYPATEKAFIDLGVTQFPQLYTQHHASSLFEELETGKLSPVDFYKSFRTLSGIELNNEEIAGAWNAMLGKFIQENLQWLDTVKDKYRIFLFSNTNQVHHDSFSRTFITETGKENFDDYFIKAYYSHTFGLRKPYVTSYIKLLEEQQLDAAETLFIDDTVKNIEGAKQAGLQTIHLLSAKQLPLLGL